MMTKKILLLLSGIAVIIILATLWVNRGDSPHGVSQFGKPIFSQLLDQLNNVQDIVIKHKDNVITLQKTSQEQWTVKEKDNYPANVQSVRSLLLNSAELTLTETKTSNPEYYKMIGLEDVGPNAESTALSYKDKQSKDIAQFILGHKKPAKSAQLKSGIYVRKIGATQSLLAEGDLNVEKSAIEWVNKEILTIEDDRIKRVSIAYPDKNQLILEKENRDEKNYKVKDLPKKAELQSTFTVNNIAYGLEKLKLKDVMKADKINFSANEKLTALMESYDGIKITVQINLHDNKPYARLSAAFADDLVEVVEDKPLPDTAQPKQEVNPTNPAAGKPPVITPADKKNQLAAKSKKEVETFNLGWQGWAYELSETDVNNFAKRLKDLLKQEQKAEKTTKGVSKSEPTKPKIKPAPMPIPAPPQSP